MKDNVSVKKESSLRVWWIPQVPGKPFHISVDSIKEGRKILEVLANYDLFQYENNIKPDYSNVGGLQEFDSEDKTDSPKGSWIDMDELDDYDGENY